MSISAFVRPDSIENIEIYDDQAGVEHLTEVTDIDLTSFWLDVPDFGKWGRVARHRTRSVGGRRVDTRDRRFVIASSSSRWQRHRPRQGADRATNSLQVMHRTLHERPVDSAIDAKLCTRRDVPGLGVVISITVDLPRVSDELLSVEPGALHAAVRAAGVRHVAACVLIERSVLPTDDPDEFPDASEDRLRVVVLVAVGGAGSSYEVLLAEPRFPGARGASEADQMLRGICWNGPWTSQTMVTFVLES